MNSSAKVLKETAAEVKRVFNKTSSQKDIADKPGHGILKDKYTPIDTYGVIRTETGNKHDYRPSTIFGYFLNNASVEQNNGQIIKTNSIQKSRNENPKTIVAENISPSLTVTSINKTKTLVKRQGTSARILRSRGFIG